MTVITDEGAQELRSRSELTAKELLREVGAVLRMSEAEAAQLGAVEIADDVEAGLDAGQTMIINMGPQHPSTHGVLRLMLELQGETVLRCKPIVGYLHTGMEKTGETLTFMQGGTNVTRMDYASPLINELVFSLATEKLLGIDEVFREAHQVSIYTLQSMVHYLQEVSEGEPLRVTAQLLESDAKKLRVFFSMRHGETEVELAAMETLLLHMDMAAKRAAPFLADTQARVSALQQQHAEFEWPLLAGRSIALTRPR
jgi:acyl-CoA thioesterase FadM